jgi:ATP-dependent Lon protease
MYNGYWEINKNYKKGDVIYVCTLAEYYICINEHISDRVTFPNKEDIYWMYISNNFLEFFKKVNKIDNIPEPKYNNKYENELNTLVDNVIKDSLSEIKKKSPVYLKRSRSYKECNKRNELKRKLRMTEDEIINYKRQKNNGDDLMDNLKNKLLCMDLSIETKSFLLDKYESIRGSNSSDNSKTLNWLNTIVKIPYGKCKDMEVKSTDNVDKLKMFFKKVKDKLDRNIYGLENVKDEILEFVARKITNPNSKGHVLALYGEGGTGKTMIIKSLSEALDLPFYQINFGGLNDVSVLTGHSETYIGSKPGKLVEILTCSNYMNPIIYLDEIDKISETRATEIFGLLTHLLDEEQNAEFEDNYLSNIKIDLSKVFFVIAFNDISKVNPILLNRLKVIYIDPPSIEDKVIICQTKLIPNILKNIKLKSGFNIILERELIEYIIACKTQDDKGLRQLQKNIEKIFNRLNYDILIDNLELVKKETQTDLSDTTLVITKSYIDKIIKSSNNDKSYLQMYN